MFIPLSIEIFYEEWSRRVMFKSFHFVPNSIPDMACPFSMGSDWPRVGRKSGPGTWGHRDFGPRSKGLSSGRIGLIV